MPSGSELLRIGEFARRVGVSQELLRAWERRYGLLHPVRSPGGYRLYTEEDAERVARMRRALGEGVSAAQAARAAMELSPAEQGVREEGAARLLAAIESYDEPEAHAVLDESFTAFGLEVLLRDVILPTLHRVGTRWEAGTLEISQEHFASHLIRGRLLALARLWGRGSGPLALLACLPGESHDISLLAFGLLLRSYGWRIIFLGGDTPMPTLEHTAEATHPSLAVLTSFDSAGLLDQAPAVRHLANVAPLVLSGPGATAAVCAQLRVRRLNGDLFHAAEKIAHSIPA